MAKSFKQLLGDDVKNTRTLLHESIPITGTISSGTYNDNNIKTFSHGIFQNIYDYPYLSSSANHIFDISYGHSSHASQSSATQNAKKLNIYNQMAQVLMGYNVTGAIRNFDSDGELDDATSTEAPGRMDQCFFVNFSRLLTKDEIKKNTFRLNLYNSGTVGIGQVGGAPESAYTGRTNNVTIGDYASSNEYRISPAGDYGLLFTGSGNTAGPDSVGLVFYQAGIAVLTSSIFQAGPRPFLGVDSTNIVEFGYEGGPTENTGTVSAATLNHTIDQLGDGLRYRIDNISFNNTIELNSTIYFCRVNHNEFNYSSNPTYLSGSKLVTKNQPSDLPISYITTVGLYSPDNELMAVAKLSEPIRKDPNTELTLRVRLDY